MEENEIYLDKTGVRFKYKLVIQAGIAFISLLVFTVEGTAWVDDLKYTIKDNKRYIDSMYREHDRTLMYQDMKIRQIQAILNIR